MELMNEYDVSLCITFIHMRGGDDLIGCGLADSPVGVALANDMTISIGEHLWNERDRFNRCLERYETESN